MARKYARDNRGRFAPKGAGATARGGRLKTAGGNKRETQKIAALSGDRMSSVPKGAIGKTRKQREITMIDRPQGQRVAYNQGRAQQQAAIAARKAPRPSAAKRIKANAPSNTVGNKTGQSKTLNKFNSRPERTRGAYVGGRYVDKAKLTGRQPLDLGRGDDRAFGRVATKSAQKQAAVSSRTKPAAKRRGAIGQISEAKAGRIVARMDANRPGLRRASASPRKTANAIRTHQKATDFALASGARARKKGQNLSVNQSLQRAVANAAKKRKR